MIIEDEMEMDMDSEFFFGNVGSHVKPTRNPDRLQAFLQTYRNIENTSTHIAP
jgi:hypothetical protein